MPRATSSSSSEDDEDSHPTESPKTTTYQCPDDFVPFCHKPCSSTLTESLKNDDNELWLIKAPASFNPECFSGIKVPLSGIQTLKVPTAPGGAKTGSSQQIYSILASPHGTSELHLLTSGERSSGGVVFGPAFTGLLNVCENYGDSGANQAPQVIHATPPPSLPPGLKQRFHPFGSKTPTLTCVAESEVDGAAMGPSSATLCPLDVKRFVEETWQEEEGRKRKKKKNKEKRIKTELPDEVVVKVEPVAEVQRQWGLPFQQGDALEETTKKKKKRKDRERKEVEEGVEPSVTVKEEVTVKCEPVDDSYGDVAMGKKKKKKKKKGSKPGDD
uniref:RNA polymerase I subunit G n=1 Tax=Cyclopterus lumpus TaxID=8103 RepID=A0A8C2ZK59_CYCLU